MRPRTQCLKLDAGVLLDSGRNVGEQMPKLCRFPIRMLVADTTLITPSRSEV
jgi:hypothetical protein